MSMRSVSLYVTPLTIKRLRLALKLYPELNKKSFDVAIEQRSKTPDELGDELINEMIVKDFPLVRKLENELTHVEREFMTRELKQTTK